MQGIDRLLCGRVVPLILAMVCCQHAEAESLNFYVAIDGNDAFSGKLPAVNATKTDGPFATLTQARDAIRQCKADGGLTMPVNVLVRAGTYFMPKSLEFRPEDSGTIECPICYTAFGDEKVVLSGGRKLTGWKPYQRKIWQCDLKTLGLEGLRSKQLFCKGTRQPLARVPNVDPKHPRTGGWAYAAKTWPIAGYNPEKDDRRWVDPYNVAMKTHVIYDMTQVDPTRWKKPTLAEVSVFPWACWNNNIVPVQEVDTQRHVVTLAGKGASYKIIRGNRFFVQNVFEELDAPGEWYLDGDTATLYFWPPDEKLLESSVVLPVLDQVIVAKGNAAKNLFVTNLRLAGFTIEATRRTAIVLQTTRRVTVAKSVFRNVGEGAVYLGGGGSGNRVLGNDITDTGTYGIRVRDGARNLVANNHLHHFSEVLRNNPGINVRGTANTVSHNLIHDCPRRGVSFSGTENIVEFNHIHHVNLEAKDSCAIGMWAGSYESALRQMGNTIRHNLVRHTGGYCMQRPGEWRFPHHSYGIRMDDLVSGVVVQGNIIVDSVSGAVQIHSGKHNRIENNIMIEGRQTQTCFSNHLSEFKKTESDMSDNRFVRNIVYYRNPEARLFTVGGWTEKMIAEADHNVYFHFGDDLVIHYLPNTKPSESFAKWREFGYDAHSVVADPLFVDAEHGDYRLRPDSPAWKLGFQRIPVEKIGLKETDDRATWPVDEQNDIWREAPLLDTTGAAR